MRLERPRPRPDPLDRVGFGLIAGGGCLTLIVVPVVFLVAVGFLLMLAIGFASDTQATATEAEGRLSRRPLASGSSERSPRSVLGRLLVVLHLLRCTILRPGHCRLASCTVSGLA